MLQLTVFEIFVVKWQKSASERPQMVYPKPFLDPAFRTTKDIATKMGEDTPPGP